MKRGFTRFEVEHMSFNLISLPVKLYIKYYVWVLLLKVVQVAAQARISQFRQLYWDTFPVYDNMFNMFNFKYRATSFKFNS